VLAPATALSMRDLDRRCRPLVERARKDLRSEGFAGRRAVVARGIDARYVGQSYEITVPYTERYRAAFDRAHRRTYGYADEARPVEVVAVRVTGTGRTEPPRLARTRRMVRAKPTPVGVEKARFGGREVRTRHYLRDDLVTGMRVAGPAVIAGDEATTVLPPGWSARVDSVGSLICAYQPR
jgi:N-methylhydantoinase A